MDQSIQSYLKPELDEASKVLLRAADLIEDRGWCQRALEDDMGRYCAIGAILQVPGTTDERSVAATRLMKSICERDVAVWNNAPGRTKEEVVAKLRAVALGG